MPTLPPASSEIFNSSSSSLTLLHPRINFHFWRESISQQREDSYFTEWQRWEAGSARGENQGGILCHLENYCWDEGAKMQVNGTLSCCESGVKWSLLLVSFSLWIFQYFFGGLGKRQISSKSDIFRYCMPYNIWSYIMYHIIFSICKINIFPKKKHLLKVD